MSYDALSLPYKLDPQTRALIPVADRPSPYVITLDGAACSLGTTFTVSAAATADSGLRLAPPPNRAAKRRAARKARR